MTHFIMSSVMVLFAIIFTVSVNSSFADDSITITTASDNLNVPGCEETTVGCYTPDAVTVDVGGKVVMLSSWSVSMPKQNQLQLRLELPLRPFQDEIIHAK
jgi:hypothetical protein